MSAPRQIGAIVSIALAATLALHAAGTGALATPPLRSWEELNAWYLGSDPVVAVVALLRVVGLAAAGWLVLVGGLQLVAPFVAVDRFSTLVDRLSPRFLRALSRSTVGLSVTAGLALPVLPSAPAENPPGTAVMVPLDAPARPASTSTTMPSTTTTAAPTPTTVPSEPEPPDPEPPAAAPVVAPSVRADEVVVAPGDSFWSIAVDEAGERDLVEYWRALIEANRDRLVDGSNPDLLYPEQVLRLP